MPDGFESRSEGSDSTAEALESPCEGFDSRREDIESRREGTDSSRGLFIRNYRYKSMGLPNGLNLAGNARRKLRQPPRRLNHLRRKCRGVPALPGFPGAEKAPVASAAEVELLQIGLRGRGPPGMPESLRCLAFQPAKAGAIGSFGTRRGSPRPFRPQY